MNRLFLRGPLYGLLWLALGIAPAHGADLLMLYRQALDNDAQYSSARYALAAGREKEPQGRAGLLPNANATAYTTANYADSNFHTSIPGAILPPPSNFFNTNGYTVTLTQPLFRWQNWQTWEQSKLLVMQSEAQFAQSGQDLIVRVAQAYFDVLAAQDALAVAQAQKVAIDQQLAQAKRNFEVGKSTVVDTNEAQSRYDLAGATEIAAQNDLDTKRAALQVITGRPAGDLAPLRGDIALPAPQPAQIQPWVDAAEANNYTVKAQESGMEAARREVEINRAGHYPTLDLTAQRLRQDATGGTTFGVPSETTQNSIGVQLGIPIFSGGLTTSKTREAAANFDRARTDLEFQRRSAAQNARQYYLAVTNGLAQVRAYEAAVVSSQSSLDSNKLGYEVGVRINIDVLNAQQQLYQTKQNLAKARYDTIVNGFRLKASAGSLAEDDVKAANALLNP
ncbi:MAG TPA: TolC family outer membrane protein [Burkholderiales bacterium]|jgi:outer membrane protein